MSADTGTRTVLKTVKTHTVRHTQTNVKTMLGGNAVVEVTHTQINLIVIDVENQKVHIVLVKEEVNY